MPENEPYDEFGAEEIQAGIFWSHIFVEIASRHVDKNIEIPGDALTAVLKFRQDNMAKETQRGRKHERRPRRFTACVFCALLDWSETRVQANIKDMHKPADVAWLLSADWYHKQWPLIPLDELYSSAVDFPHKAPEGSMTTMKVLMHKRRVSEQALAGEAPLDVCLPCYEALWRQNPYVPKSSLANFLWLGRHPLIFRDTTLGHQLLLALGRVVSTKVYLSSKGVDQSTRQHLESWRQKFLQKGMSGTAIVYGNGNIDHVMSSFPPSQDVLQDTFVAVFAGSEDVAEGELSAAQKEEIAPIECLPPGGMHPQNNKNTPKQPKT